MAQRKQATNSQNSLPKDSDLYPSYFLKDEDEIELRLMETIKWAKEIEASTQEIHSRQAAQIIRVMSQIILYHAFDGPELEGLEEIEGLETGE